MARNKDKLQTGKFNLTSDLDIDDFNVDDIDKMSDPETKKKGSRKAISNAFKGTIKGAMDASKSPAFLGRVLRSSLPDSYGEASDGAAEIVKGFSSLYDEAARDLKPQLAQMAKKVDKLVPEEQKRLKSVTQKLKKVLGVDDSEFRRQSEEEAQNNAISSSLGEIFAAQQDANNTNLAQDRAANKIRDEIESKRFQSNFGILSMMGSNLEKLTKYNDRVNQAYQKKSLELQFRTLFTLNELNRNSKQYFEIFKLQNEAITKNTSLPEYVKIKESERFKEIGRRKLYEGVQQKLFGQGSAIQQGMQRIQKAALQRIKGLKFALQNANFGLDGATMANDMMGSMGDMGDDPELTKEYMAGQMVGDQLAKWGGGAFGKFLKKFSSKHPGIVRMGNKLASGMGNINATATDFRNSKRFKDIKAKGGIVGGAASGLDWFLKQFTDVKSNGRISQGKNLGELDHPHEGGLTNRAVKSITDIIPGYLSRILREITVLRTGDESTAVTGFDWRSGKFKSNAQIKDGIMKKLRGNAKNSNLDWYTERASNNLLGKKKVSEKQQYKLKKFMSSLSREKNMTYDESRITASDSFKSLDAKTQKLVRQQLRKTITADQTGEGQKKFTEAMGRVRSQQEIPVGDISTMIESGYGEMLEEEGIITQAEDGSYSVDQDKYIAFLEENGIAKSDKYVKRDIVPFGEGKREPTKAKKRGFFKKTGRDALAAIKKTKVYDWFYKRGKGDNKLHSGPMAQDVEKNLGSDAAPGGTSLDLVTMNGVNMAAIQELEKKVNGKTGTGQDILALIKEDTGKLVELAESGKMGGFGFNMEGVKGGFAKAAGKFDPKAMFAKFGIKGDGSYSDIFKQMTGNAIDAVTKISKDVFGMGQQAYGFAKDKTQKGFGAASSFIKKAYADNKDKIKETIGNVFEKIQGLTSNALDLGKNFITNQLPAGWKQAAEMGKKGMKKFNEMLHGTKDIYVKGMSTPALRANLMAMGNYFDQASGEVIKSFKDIKGPVVDKLGNVVLTTDDIARGLVGVDGKPLGQLFKKLTTAAMGVLANGLSVSSNVLAKMLEGAAPFAEKLGNGLKGFMENGIGLGFGNKKIYDVLVEIRDLVRGDDPEPHENKRGGSGGGSGGGKPEEFVGPKPLTKAQKVARAIRNKGKVAADAVRGFAKSQSGEFVGPLERGSSASERPADATAGAGVSSGGMLSKAAGFAKGKLLGLAGTASGLKQHVAGFVGPKQPGMFSRAAGAIKGKLSGKLGGLLPGKAIPESLVPGKSFGLRNLLPGIGALGFMPASSGNANASNGETIMSVSKMQEIQDKLDQEEHEKYLEEKKLKQLERELKDKEKGGEGKKPAFNDHDGNGKRDGNADEREKILEEREKERKSKGQLKADLTAKYVSSGVLDKIFGKAKSLLGGLFGGDDGSGIGVDDVLDNLPEGKKGKRGIFSRMKRAMKARKLKAARAGKKAGLLRRGASWIGKKALSMPGGVGRAMKNGFIRSGKIANFAKNVALSKPVTWAGSKLLAGPKAVGKFLGRKALRFPGGVGKALVNGVTRSGKAVRMGGRIANGAIKLAPKLGSLMKAIPLLGAIMDTTSGMKDLMADPNQKNGTFNSMWDFLNPFKYGAFAGKQINNGAASFLSMLTGHDTSIGSFAADLSEKFKDAMGIQKKYDPNADSSLETINAEHKRQGKPQFKTMEEYKAWLAEEKKKGEAKRAQEAAARAQQPAPAPTSGVTVPVKPGNPPQLDQSGAGGEDGKAGDVRPKTETGGPSGVTGGGLKVADGPVKDGSGGDQYIKKNDSGVDLSGVRPSVMKNFKGMAQEYGEKTGKSILVTSAFRSQAKQAELHRQDPAKASPPGNSVHEVGLALDINTPDAVALDKLGLMRKYGFTRPVGGETWHIEPAGIQGNIKKAKEDLNFADSAIEASLGKGGGGIGGDPSAKKYSRDTKGAIALWNMGASSAPNPGGSDKDKANDALAPKAQASATQGTKDLADAASKAASNPKTGAADTAKTAASNAASNTSNTASNSTPGSNPATGSNAPAGAPYKDNISTGTVAQSQKYSKTAEVPTASIADGEAANGTGKQATGGGSGVKCDPNDIKGTIAACAKKAGGDPNLMQAFAAVESGFNPNARAKTSSATGLFQFTNDTWNQQMSEHAAKYNIPNGTSATDVEASSLLATELTKYNAKILRGVKSDLNLTDMYLAHFLGAGGARQFLKADPNAIGAEVMPKAAGPNKPIFYDKSGRARTISEIYSEISTRLSNQAAARGITIPIARLGDKSSGGSYSPVGDSGSSGGGYTGAYANSSGSSGGSSSGSSGRSTGGSSAPATGNSYSGSSYSSGTGSAFSPMTSSAVSPGGNSGSGAGLGQVSSILGKSYDIQVKTYDVLKQILAAVAKSGTIGGDSSSATSDAAKSDGSGSSTPNPANKPITASNSGRGIFKLPESAIDLKRSA